MRFIIFLFFISIIGFAQKSYDSTVFPKFENCESLANQDLKACFYDQVSQHFYNALANDSLRLAQDKVHLLFDIDETGKKSIFHLNAQNNIIKEKVLDIFKTLPETKPGYFEGKPNKQRFTVILNFPLEKPIIEEKVLKQSTSKELKNNQEHSEFDNIVYLPFENPIYESRINLPFTHQNYALFDAWLNQVGTNNHTASKPYTYQDVQKYFNLKNHNQQLMKEASSWLAKKWWNENMVTIQGDGYWFTLDPIADLSVGKDFNSDVSYTYQNTRGLRIQGALGKNLSFTTNIYESQGRFADYYNQLANSLRPSGGNPAIIPGIGIAKEFKTDAYDMPLAEANIIFSPSKFIDLELGYNRNFIGDGYRSLLLSDGASPYPFVKINTNFWKIKYTNLYTWLKDVRDEVTEDRTYATKFMAAHYLSWNATKRLNIGLFESVVWANTNDRGFDMSFVNPIIFYRAVEFSSSSRSGNALLGLTAKYKYNNSINFYGQFLIDEFSFGEVSGVSGSWKNKFGFQLGAKYYNAFNIDNLTLQMEYNAVRPYTYAHSEVITNYGHNNQSLGHNWGANQKEVVLLGHYNKKRWFGFAKLIYGIRGFDFNTSENNFNYGGNIYIDYDENRPFDSGVAIGQGNKTNLLIADLQAGYIINPTTNLKVFGNFVFRNFDPTLGTENMKKSTTTWLSLGFRTDLFNWYKDY